MAQRNLPAQFVTTIAAAPRAVAPGAEQPALKILWVTDLDYDYGWSKEQLAANMVKEYHTMLGGRAATSCGADLANAVD